jgi:hypothetical protein
MKRILSSILAMIMIFAILPVSSFATDGPAYIEPKLIMVSPNTYTVEPGDDLRLDIELYNSGEYEAEKIIATLSSDRTGMVLVDGKSFQEESSIGSEERETLRFDVEVNRNAPDGTYDMNLEVVYYDDYLKKEFTLDKIIHIRVIQEDTRPDLVISRTDVMPSTTVNPGDPVVVGFELLNKGEGPARNITVSLPELSEESLLLANGLSIQRVPDIAGGRKGYVYFELQASNTIRPGNHEMMVQLTYRDGDNNPVEAQEYFSFQATKMMRELQSL